jgi:hypothetical protein
MKRHTILLISISLFFTALSVFCAFLLAPSISAVEYAVLKIDAKLNDENAVSLLNANGFYDIEAASTQYVFLNDFDKIKQIPLHQYRDYVFPFDPRNDGYADTLLRFFSNDEHQYIFISLKNFNASSKTIAGKIDAVLAEIPHELEFIGKTKPKHLPWLLFLASLASMFYFFKKVRSAIIIFLPMVGFSFWGSSGFIVSALLVMFFSTVINPLRELISSRFRKKNQAVFEHLYVYRYSWVSSGVFFVLYAISVFFVNISILYSMILFLVLVGLCVFSILIEESRSKSAKRSRFLPLPILSERFCFSEMCILGFPFIISSVILLFLSFFLNYPSNSFDFDPNRLVTKADFEKHLQYQQNFSFVPLGETGGNHQYKTYQLGDDGLVVDDGMLYSESSGLIDSVFFPLDDLVNQFQGISSQTLQWISSESIIPLFCFVCLVSFAIILRFKNGSRKKIISMYNDKRIAA